MKGVCSSTEILVDHNMDYHLTLNYYSILN